MVLPFAADRFRETSVTDVPGEWGPHFDDVRASVESAGDLVIPPAPADEPSDDAAYRRVVDALFDEALALARVEYGDATPAHQVLAVVIWDGVVRGADDMSAVFIDEARRRGIAVEQIRTLDGE